MDSSHWCYCSGIHCNRVITVGSTIPSGCSLRLSWRIFRPRPGCARVVCPPGGNERNPVEGCSWWSFLTFAWLTPTLQAGPRDGPRSHPVHHNSTRTACGARAVETRGDCPSGWLTWVPSQPGGRIEADCALETCAMSAGPIHGNHAAVAENMRFGGAGSVIAGNIARCGDADAQGAAAAGVGQHRGARVGLRARHRGPRQRPRAREPPRARSLERIRTQSE